MEEPNLFLDLILAAIFTIFIVVIVAVIWLTKKFRLLECAEDYHITAVIRDALLSLLGVFVLAIMFGIFFLIIEFLKAMLV